MVVRLRFQRFGRTNRPIYRIIAIYKRKKRQGRALEYIGTYDPQPCALGNKQLRLNVERCKYWLANGAQPSKPVARLLSQFDLYPQIPRIFPIKYDLTKYRPAGTMDGFALGEGTQDPTKMDALREREFSWTRRLKGFHDPNEPQRYTPRLRPLFGGNDYPDMSGSMPRAPGSRPGEDMGMMRGAVGGDDNDLDDQLGMWPSEYRAMKKEKARERDGLESEEPDFDPSQPLTSDDYYTEPTAPPREQRDATNYTAEDLITTQEMLDAVITTEEHDEGEYESMVEMGREAALESLIERKLDPYGWAMRHQLHLESLLPDEGPQEDDMDFVHAHSLVGTSPLEDDGSSNIGGDSLEPEGGETDNTQ